MAMHLAGEQAPLARFPLGSATDAILVDAALGGKRDAFEAIFHRYHALVRAIVCRSLGVSDAPDLIQETFLRLFRSLSTLQKPSALKAFLTGIAVRVVRNELRSRRVRSVVTYEDADVAAGSADGNSLANSQELVVALYRDLAKLGSDERLAFVLRYVQGMTLPEVAEHLECSLATAKRRIAAALESVDPGFRGGES